MGKFCHLPPREAVSSISLFARAGAFLFWFGVGVLIAYSVVEAVKMVE